MNENKYKILLWKEHTEKYENYWNNEEVESISNNIVKGEYLKLEKHIENQGFMLDLQKCLDTLSREGRRISGVGAELACETMRLTARLMKMFHNKIQKFYSIDYSQRYIFKLGPSLLNHYKIAHDKLTLCLGSFYEIKLPAESLDFIIMSQPFHHAEDPDKLLKEAYRVLKKDGF